MDVLASVTIRQHQDGLVGMEHMNHTTLKGFLKMKQSNFHHGPATAINSFTKINAM